MSLDVAAAEKVIDELAVQLNLNRLEAAEGTLTVVNSNMANAIRSKTVQKGIDPRDYALAAFGGAGPLHGAEVARMLGIPEVIVPPYPGITSAMGLLTTDLKYDIVRTEFQVSTDFDYERLNREFKAMKDALVAQFAADGIAAKTIRFERHADARYVGQGYELRVGIADGALAHAAMKKTLDEFHAVHKREYGHSFADSPVEIVNIRLTGIAPAPKIGRFKPGKGGTLKEALVKRGRSVFRHRDQLRAFDTAFYRRERLPLKTAIKGPAIILQIDSTTVVPPGCTITADESGNLILKVGAA
jgi:N-methylhydantoinase A